MFRINQYKHEPSLQRCTGGCGTAGLDRWNMTHARHRALVDVINSAQLSAFSRLIQLRLRAPFTQNSFPSRFQVASTQKPYNFFSKRSPEMWKNVWSCLQYLLHKRLDRQTKQGAGNGLKVELAGEQASSCAFSRASHDSLRCCLVSILWKMITCGNFTGPASQ